MEEVGSFLYYEKWGGSKAASDCPANYTAEGVEILIITHKTKVKPVMIQHAGI